MTTFQGWGNITCSPNTYTISPNSWGLQLSTFILLVGLDQRQVSNQGQAPHLPQGCSKLTDQKLGQQSGQADTITMKASWVEHLQLLLESLFYTTLRSWKRRWKRSWGWRESMVWPLWFPCIPSILLPWFSPPTILSSFASFLSSSLLYFPFISSSYIARMQPPR